MTSQRSCNTSGIILVDVLLGLSLAAFFSMLISESVYGSRQVFERAQERSRLLDAFELGTQEAEVHSSQGYFGNDRIENNVIVSSPHIASSSDPAYDQSITFSHVQASDSDDFFEFAGTPICSVDFSRRGRATNVLIDPITLPVNPLLPLTDIEIRNEIAYISTDSTTASDPDLLVVDIRDHEYPILKSSINTGPGISSIVLAGKRIFAAAASTAFQLHVIHIDDPASLSLEKKYHLILPYATATTPLASSIFYHQGLVYLGTEKWSGSEFSVIDVSNPADPVEIGGFETGSKINDIFVRNGVAYVAASDHDQLRLLDISDPTTPIITDSLSPSGWQRQEGKVIYSFENILDVGRTSGGFNIATDHELFHWEDSISSANLPPPKTLDIPGGVYGIVPDHNRIYLATRFIDREFQILDRSLSTTTVHTYSLPIAPQRLTCDNDHLYILAATAPVIYEISFN